MKRKHIEDLILAISPDTDVHLFTKRELRFVLVHEIAHLKMRAARNTILPEDEVAPVELTPAEAFRMFAILSSSLPSYPTR